MSLINEQILPAAVLAPSAHNTQPWRFAAGENYLDVLIEWKRHLSVSDPTERELYISLGCAIDNATVAAAHAGYRTQLTPFPNGREKNQPVARLHFESDTTAAKDLPPLVALSDRRTDRSLYDGKPLTESERSAVRALQHPHVFFIEDREKITSIAKASEEGTFRTLSRPDFKAELSKWVRNSWTRQPDGMPGYAMGMPAPLSLLAPFMVKVAPIHKQEAPKARRQIESVSALAVIATPQDDPISWLTAGQMLERVWLHATAAGLAAAAVAAAIEGGADLRQKVQQALATDLLPQAILRLGHSQRKNLKATPRRRPQDCLQ